MIKDDPMQLIKEFKSYMQYWLLHMYSESTGGIYPEISQANVPNKTADMGSMYLSRIIYGASRACIQLKTDQFKPLADAAFGMLKDFKNPSGGYFWSRKYNMEWLHDPENVNMAQAFILYGLAEYERLNNSKEISHLLDEQIDFVESVLKDDDNEWYLDGFDEHWIRDKDMTRSFATHFHLMEALVKVYENRRDEKVRNSIRGLLDLILDRFIEKKNYSCIHRFTEDWQMLPNENWAGHNAECSWVICHAAKAIDDTILINRTEEFAVFMMNKVIDSAKDKVNGGYANLVFDNGNIEKEKSWWPQGEVVLGLINVFKITGDDKYQRLALDQIGYIQKNFINDFGEWHTALDEKGMPKQGIPQIFFWKSMYHTVRYYDYLLENL